MRNTISLLLLSTLFIFASCGDKKDKKENNSLAKVGGSAEANKTAFLSMMNAFDQSVFYWEMKGKQLLDKSGFADLAGGFATIMGADFSKNYHITAGKYKDELAVLFMFGIADAEMLETNLETYGASVKMEAHRGLRIGKVKYQKVDLFVAMNNNMAIMMPANFGFKNKSEWRDLAVALFENGAKKKVEKDYLKKLAQKDEDLMMWVSMTNMKNSLDDKMRADLEKLMDQVNKGSNTNVSIKEIPEGEGYFSLNFEAGKIAAKYEIDAPGLDNKKVFDHHRFANSLTDGDLIAYFFTQMEVDSLVVNMKGSKQFKDIEEKLGFDPALLSEVLDGGIAMGMSDYPPLPESDEAEESTSLIDDLDARLDALEDDEEVKIEDKVKEELNKVDPKEAMKNIVFNIGLKENSENKVIEVLNSVSELTGAKGMYKTKEGINIVVRSNKILVTGSDEVANSFFAKGELKTVSMDPMLLSQQLSGLFDFKGLSDYVLKASGNQEMADFMALFESAEMYGGTQSGSFEIILTDKNNNALEAIILAARESFASNFGAMLP